MTLLRRTTVTALATALGLAGVLVAAAPAEAASDYRFWSYWHVAPGAGSWTYAGTGPAGYRVDDGGVEGWRFVVAVPNPSAPAPRTSPAEAFRTVCGGTERPEGKDRVALVVDFGAPGDAPPKESPPGTVRGTCVVVDDRSTGLDVLAQAGYAPRRDGGGLVCGLAGYPSRECGVVVERSSPAPTATPRPAPTRTAVEPRPTTSAGSATTAGPGGSAGPAASGDPRPSSALPSTASTADRLPGPTAAASAGAGPEDTGPALAVGPPPAPPAGGSGTPVALLVGAGLVAALGGAAVLRGRGHSSRPTA